MKKIFNPLFVLTLLLTSSILYAQTPQAMNYQSVARNSSGALLQDQYVSARFSIHDGSPSASIVYQETDTATTNQFGLFTAQIGNGTVTVGTFATINWATGNKFLEVELDPAGGQNFSDMGTQELFSVPYALYAQTSGNGGNNNGFTHYIGQLYAGGIVVSVWKDTSGTEHGLIASLTDVATQVPWSNVTTLIGASAEDPSNGSSNTAAIIGQAGETSSAALLCHNYSGGGYNDWYLPAIWELNQCCMSAMIVNHVLGNTNGFQFTNYWSSTETSGNSVTYQYMPNPFATNPTIAPKSTDYNVRAVRQY